jgi:hypothetical protein
MEIVFEAGRPGSLQEFEPWAYHYAMVDGAKHFLFKRTHHEARRNATSTLLLQHYGCPTSGLDITADPDCAAMFAFGDFNYNITGAITWGTGRKRDSKRCVYVLLMKDGRDPHLRSSVMFKGSKNESRIERQKCGILFGSSWACRNFAQRHIALKLELDFDVPGSIDPRFVYPLRSEDSLCERIVERFASAYETLGRSLDKGPSPPARYSPSNVDAW